MSHLSISSSELRRFVIRFAFSLTLFLGLVNILRLCVPKRLLNPTFYQKWAHCVDQPRGTYNHLAIGSSRILCHLRPFELDSICAHEGLDLSTFNFGSPATGSPQTLDLLDDILASPLAEELKLITMELTIPLPNDKVNSTYHNHFWNWKNTYIATRYLWQRNVSWEEKRKNSLLLFQHFLSAQLLLGQKNILDHFFSLHAHWRTEDYCYVEERGYQSLDQKLENTTPQGFWASRHEELLAKKKSFEETIEKNIESHKGPVPSQYSKHHVEFLKEKIEMAREKGVYLLFVLPPPQRMGTEGLAILNHLPESHVLDYTNPEQYPELYKFEHLFDINHLNDKGGQFFTAAIASKLVDLDLPSAQVNL
ncbi:MAG: hypothetical protein ACPGYK_06635 [Flavobacteriales bacterium]